LKSPPPAKQVISGSSQHRGSAGFCKVAPGDALRPKKNRDGRLVRRSRLASVKSDRQRPRSVMIWRWHFSREWLQAAANPMQDGFYFALLRKTSVGRGRHRRLSIGQPTANPDIPIANHAGSPSSLDAVGRSCNDPALIFNVACRRYSLVACSTVGGVPV
jgi:hypothetical protein